MTGESLGDARRRRLPDAARSRRHAVADEPAPKRPVLGRQRLLGTATAIFLSCAALSACTAGDDAGQASDAAANAEQEIKCGPDVTPIPTPQRQINLVLDESGSMFADPDEAGNVTPSSTWSIAKYSLEVFAALLGSSDQLNVYRMSDYGPVGSPSTPTLTLSGTEGRAERVAQIHDMELAGASTPWRSVTAAAENLLTSDAEQKWLVILTDGEFKIRDQPVPPEEVVAYLGPLIQQGVRVAFMSIGDQAVKITPVPEVIYEQVADADQLLGAMTGFANTIFERTYVDLGTTTSWSTDIPLDEVVLFAQGPGVTVTDAQTSEGALEPSAPPVSVRWTTNKPVKVSGPDGRDIRVEALPDESLEGTLADFSNVPVGDVAFNVTEASQIDLFYKPDVSFGYTIIDAQGADVGNVLAADQPYTLNYSFMTPDCIPVTSPLLDPVEYSAQILQGGQVVKDGLSPGSPVQLPAADYTLRVAASYNGGSAGAEIPLIVSAGAQARSLQVSAMSQFPANVDGLPIYVYVEEGELSRPFSPQEWAGLQAEAVTFSEGNNLEYEFAKGEKPGEAAILVRAPGGDVFDADTGDLDVTMTIPAVGDVRASTVPPVRFTVVDDLTAMQRFLHWFWTVGIWIVLVVVLLAIAIGYIFKPRFPKISKRPQISVRNRAVRNSPLAFGTFRVKGIRKWLPFVADQATLGYVPPGTPGFAPLKLKATQGRMFKITNVSTVAKRRNVLVDGNLIDDNFQKGSIFGLGTTVTAKHPPNATFTTTLQSP